MKTLFAKIFIWFFVSLAVLVLASYGVTRLMTRDPTTVVRRWGDPFLLHAEYARETLARDGRDGLVRLLDRMDQASRLHPYVIDKKGRDLRGRPVPAEADSAAREVFAGRPLAQPKKGQCPQCFAYSIGTGAGIDTSVLVLMPPGKKHRFTIPYDASHNTALIVVLIGIGGALCYGLSRHLTAPVTRLRRAVARLAAGDLSARVAGARAAGGDELAALDRDFNQMAERIETLVASHRRLLRDVSHELRSPLARIRVAIGLAQQQLGEASRSAEPSGNGRDGHGSTKVDRDQLVGRIEREVERLESLIAQVLTLSRFEARSATANAERFDLAELVHGISEDARFEAHAKGCDVQFLPSGPVPVRGEIAVIRSAIENVVRNAVRVSAPGSVVEIELRPGSQSGSATVRILDRGPGVPVEDLGSIFEPFTRSETSRDRQSGGVGLGLAIARRAVESHGGKIRAHLRPGGGLVVEMRFQMDAIARESTTG